ncbi:uncharacterized protein G2W53_004114 [Senna tora]|uniref:Uncharacterized protein n=1 Tax=Senna tora TaxID=362788 RepID=A0A835CHP8_9FABA|nr:uncharacterized protein G2W53_004114 [Senna tora]
MRKNKSIRAEIVPDFSHGAIFSPVRSPLHGAALMVPLSAPTLLLSLTASSSLESPVRYCFSLEPKWWTEASKRSWVY